MPGLHHIALYTWRKRVERSVGDECRVACFTHCWHKLIGSGVWCCTGGVDMTITILILDTLSLMYNAYLTTDEWHTLKSVLFLKVPTWCQPVVKRHVQVRSVQLGPNNKSSLTKNEVNDWKSLTKAFHLISIFFFYWCCFSIRSTSIISKQKFEVIMFFGHDTFLVCVC